MSKHQSPGVRIVELCGTDEQLAVLASCGIALSPAAMARAKAVMTERQVRMMRQAQGFTASVPDRSSPDDIKAMWKRQTDKINAHNARIRS
jgi:hypothetical protein